MSFQDVLERGDEFLSEYPRRSSIWNYLSHGTCLFMILSSKAFINLMYVPKVHNIERLDAALKKARESNRSLLTVMNHMSVVDDPTFFAALPMRFHLDVDTIRWGFGAHNICFSNKALSLFFNLGKVLGTKRFGEGPFQGSIDAAIRILSPDDTLDIEYAPGVLEAEKPVLLQQISNMDASVSAKSQKLASKVAPGPEATNLLMSKSPFIRSKTSWFHVFPEGFVLQLEPPHSNSMRYFKWGVSRLILEATRSPVVLPIFSNGFEKISPEDAAETGLRRWIPSNIGSEIHIHIGDPVPDEVIEEYRQRWQNLCQKFIDPNKPQDLSEELKNGRDAKQLRGELAAFLRQSVLDIRTSTGFFTPEDPRFKDPKFWKDYTLSEGSSAPDVKFIGKNWAIRRFQKHLPDYEEE